MLNPSTHAYVCPFIEVVLSKPTSTYRGTGGYYETSGKMQRYGYL